MIEDLTKFNKFGDLEWKGMYSQEAKYKDYVDPASFAHPAKQPLVLTMQIIKHLEKYKLLDKRKDKIMDFMAGTARTGIAAELSGYEFIGLELEYHFMEMQNMNKAQLKRRIQREPRWTLIQGDARRLASLLNDKNHTDGVVSPPYQDMQLSAQSSKKEIERRIKDRIQGATITDDGKYMTGAGKYLTNYTQKHNTVGIVSPPYSQAEDGGGIAKRGYKTKISDNIDQVGERTYSNKMHNFTKQNIGNLPDKPFSEKRLIGKEEIVGIVSPPYENQRIAILPNGKTEIKKLTKERHTTDISNGESYLSAMLQVYQQAYAAGISPLVTVTKNPTKKGKLRRLDLDTANLLVQAGYTIIDYHKAILFEQKDQKLLGGGIKKELKGRISFFKRLSLQKGNVAAEWEDIIIAVIENKERVI